MNISERIAKHERIVLQFSGGKDSLATLHLLQHWWGKIAVVWCNAGDEFPETLEVIERVKQLPINFHEVRPYLAQPASVALHGYPSDIVPVKNERHRPYLTGVPLPGGVEIQDYMACCNRLLFEPLQQFAREYEATMIIRGQRFDEPMVGPVRDGEIGPDGVEYFLPLEDWTEEDVFGFLKHRRVELPAYYREVAHSLDCRTCTAFLDQSLDKLEYLKKNHPDKWRVVKYRLELIGAAVSKEKQHLDAALDLVRSP